MSESAADRADADDCCWLDALDGSDEIPRRGVLMCIRLLEVDEVLARRLQQAINVKHVNPRLRLLERHPLGNERRTEQVGKADTRRASAEEKVLFVLQLGALQLGRVDHPRESDPSRTLHVVVVDAVLVAVALEQVHSVRTRPIFKVNAAFRKYLLDGIHEFVNKGIEFLSRRACLVHAQIEWVMQVLLIVGAGIEIHRH